MTTAVCITGKYPLGVLFPDAFQTNQGKFCIRFHHDFIRFNHSVMTWPLRLLTYRFGNESLQYYAITNYSLPKLLICYSYKIYSVLCDNISTERMIWQFCSIQIRCLISPTIASQFNTFEHTDLKRNLCVCGVYIIPLSILSTLYLAPVPLSIFRSNSKFDENSERSSFKYTRPITTIFCTRHDSDTVVTCAKYRCDRPRISYTRVFWIFIEFRIRSKYA